MISRNARPADARGRNPRSTKFPARRAVTAVAALALFAAAACSSDDDNKDVKAAPATSAAASGASTAASSAAETSSAASSAAEPAASSAAAAPAAANDETGTVNLWLLEDATANPLMQKRIDEFNKTSKAKVKMSLYVNDAYKQKLQVSMGSANAPDIFFNWGGGNLKQFVDAGQVLDITEPLKASGAGEKFLPSVLDILLLDDGFRSRHSKCDTSQVDFMGIGKTP